MHEHACSGGARRSARAFESVLVRVGVLECARTHRQAHNYYFDIYKDKKEHIADPFAFDRLQWGC